MCHFETNLLRGAESLDDCRHISDQLSDAGSVVLKGTAITPEKQRRDLVELAVRGIERVIAGCRNRSFAARRPQNPELLPEVPAVLVVEPGVGCCRTKQSTCLNPPSCLSEQDTEVALDDSGVEGLVLL